MTQPDRAALFDRSKERLDQFTEIAAESPSALVDTLIERERAIAAAHGEAMHCPICDVPLTEKRGESTRESGAPGEYTRTLVSYWVAYRCPSCRRTTAPRGCEYMARQAVEGWSEQ